MITRARIFFLCFAMLAAGATASAQQIRPAYTAGQQARYTITASVETVVTSAGSNGLSSNARRELAATVLISTVSVAEHGEVTQEATIESISFRSAVNGTEQAASASGLVGKKIEYTLDSSGHLLKCAIPQPAERLGIAELLFSMTRWFPSTEVTTGQAWEASGQGPFYADGLSEISKGAKTTFKIAGLANSTATIEGAITLNQSGASTLTAIDGLTNVNVIANGKGATRFEFDTERGRMIGGATESRVEGKLSFIAPTAAGQPMQPRTGVLVETAKFSIKLIK